MAEFQVGNAWDKAQTALYSLNYSAVEWYLKDFSKKSFVLGIVDEDYELIVSGAGFKQKKGEVTAGTITEMQSLDENGDLWSSVTGASYQIKKAFPDPRFDNFFRTLLSKNDEIVGNDNDDQLLGFGGNDRIFGMAGNDALVAYIGRDTLTGGAGSDVSDLRP